MEEAPYSPDDGIRKSARSNLPEFMELLSSVPPVRKRIDGPHHPEHFIGPNGERIYL